MTPNLLTASDVARLLNVKRSTVYALCRRGELPFIRITQGSRRALIRFDPDELDAVLRERRQPGRES